MNARAQLTNVFSALAELIDGWNDAAADDSGGRDNTMLVLTIWDDGSGRIGTAHGYDTDTGQCCDVSFTLQAGYNEVGGLVEYLLEWVEGSDVWKEGT